MAIKIQIASADDIALGNNSLSAAILTGFQLYGASWNTEISKLVGSESQHLSEPVNLKFLPIVTEEFEIEQSGWGSQTNNFICPIYKAEIQSNDGVACVEKVFLYNAYLPCQISATELLKRGTFIGIGDFF